TGTLLAYEQFDLHPNIVTLAKGLGGGLPIGAVMADSEYGAVLQKSDHGTTFGGNPIACAGAVCVMKKVLADGFLADVKRKGDIIRKELSDCPNIEGISGLGMMIGITLKEPLTALDVVNKCIENGVIPLTAKNKVRLLPPLNISEDDLVKGLGILKKVISE
ncbi:MAG: aminotransferase class III-fold pyridoxal phosphate-dependent enzyme, partial [Oscillospiraceae bacterium]|nr:aminotransferase class III-fold pyridoxal phosphate-dependent enzyme [Oscillospiraceae bacterium]